MKFTKTMLMLFILLAGLVMIMPVSAIVIPSGGNVQIGENTNLYTTGSNTQIATATMSGSYFGKQDVINLNTQTSGCSYQSANVAMTGTFDKQTINNLNMYTAGINYQYISATISSTGWNNKQTWSNSNVQSSGWNYQSAKLKIT